MSNRGRGALGRQPRRRPAATAAALVLVVVVIGVDARSAAAEPLRWTADLDGVYVALGPLGAATRVEEAWDGAFGGEVSVTRVREHRRISALGLGLGGMRFVEREGGRLWADVLLATRRPFDVAMGISLGVAAQVHDVNPPRWGAQAGFWVYAGVIPYLRLGTVENTGVFIDFGLKIALPAFRW